MKPWKTNAPATARPNEGKQTSFQYPVLQAATKEIGVRENIQIDNQRSPDS
jgi:hypothetical protein